eukprot:scaffold204380_cov17-Tisochrysis_lutea.AAC.2
MEGCGEGGGGGAAAEQAARCACVIQRQWRVSRGQWNLLHASALLHPRSPPDNEAVWSLPLVQ